MAPGAAVFHEKVLLDAGQSSEPAVSFAEIVSALSFAIDLTEGAMPGHAVRSCILGMRIADQLRFSPAQRSSLYYALLLKDSGCSNNAARICQIVGGDDRVVKNAAKLQDWTQPALGSLKVLWREVLPGASPWTKVLRILRIGLHQQAQTEEMITLRCERGAQIARKMGLSALTAEAVHGLDEHWDGSGYPDRLKGEAIPILARVVAVAQHLDIFACERGPDEALKVLRERSKTWFDPSLVRVVMKLAGRQTLWAECLPTDDGDRAYQLVLALRPDAAEAAQEMRATEIDSLCEAFADVVDAKSPFTYRHSVGVAEVASQIAEELNLPLDRCRLVRRAALLHDLGKLGVPNTILDKTTSLTHDEWKVVVEHPRLTREILMRIRSFQEIAVIAGAHHERLDGTGYPEHLTGEQLSIEARAIAVADFYRALTEDRPYRVGMPHGEAMAIIRKQGAALDLDCVEALDRVERRKRQQLSGAAADEHWLPIDPVAFGSVCEA